MKKFTYSKIRFLITAGFVIAIISISAGCSKSSMANMTGTGGNGNNTGTTTPGANEVFLQGMAFSPSTITVTAGTTITWTNKDAVTHNVTSNPALFSSGAMGNGATYSFTFPDKGTFSYTCTIHPSMKGTVVVN
jgi:plastocyanin